jgi:two-component sensor histidine kinase
LPGNFDKGKPYSLGMSLIRGLSKNLHGSVAITSAQGTAIELLFSLTGEQTEDVPAPIGRTKIRSIV